MDGDVSRVKALLRMDKDGTRADMGNQIGEYTELFDQATPEQRKDNYTQVVNKYYDLATDFYEFGWGHSFHFAPRHCWEALDSSIIRHELWLAHHMGLRQGMTVMDIGCGIGGPLRNIAKFANVKVVGLNNNEYQVNRARRMAKDSNLGDLASYIKGDFMNIPAKDATYDAAYAIESTCHAPDRVGVYSEIFRILKPGGTFAAYEWVMTEKYNPNDSTHEAAKKGIERGNGLPDLESISTVLQAMRDAGFEIVENFDLATTGDIPWYQPLTSRLTPKGIFHTSLGRWISLKGLGVLEQIRLAPSGSTATLDMLQRGANCLCDAGRLQIFTPMWWVLARKPQ